MNQAQFKWLALGGLLVISILALRLWHWGPLGIKAGDDVVCSELVLTNGSTLWVVAHRTGELIDAYHVFLYRIEPSGHAFKYTLGYEDSFWWGSSLRPSKNLREVEIRSFGKFVAKYSLDRDAVVWVGGKRPCEPGRRLTRSAVEKMNLTRQP